MGMTLDYLLDNMSSSEITERRALREVEYEEAQNRNTTDSLLDKIKKKRGKK